MRRKDLATTVDFLGRSLCEPCWNGVHWRHDPVSGVLVNNCQLWVTTEMHCECECKNMGYYKREQNERNRELVKREKLAQMAIDTDDVLEIK